MTEQGINSAEQGDKIGDQRVNSAEERMGVGVDSPGDATRGRGESMAMIVRDDIKLAFENRGAGKPAFVFMHGWTCDRSFFAPQAEHFARRH
jgi:hypothetical protein